MYLLSQYNPTGTPGPNVTPLTRTLFTLSGNQLPITPRVPSVPFLNNPATNTSAPASSATNPNPSNPNSPVDGNGNLLTAFESAFPSGGGGGDFSAPLIGAPATLGTSGGAASAGSASPVVWIVLLLVIGAGVYFWRKRRRQGEGASV